MYAVRVSLILTEVQLNAINQMNIDAKKIRDLYFSLSDKCQETPKTGLNTKQTFDEITRLKKKLCK